MDGMKVLVDHEIADAIARKELVLDGDPEGCRGACYELRMGNVYYDLTESEKLFSIGLSAVATYADPGFHGHIGIVTQNISDKYIELPELEPIAKVDFTILETPATHLYRGQHGFESEIWPIKHHLQKSGDQLV